VNLYLALAFFGVAAIIALSLKTANAWRKFVILGRGKLQSVNLLFNASAEEADFRLPPMQDGVRWHLAADTGREAPQDLFVAGEESLLDSPEVYHAGQRSSAILLARPPAARVGSSVS